MKGVIINYNDGRVERFKTIYDAAWALDLNNSSFNALRAGLGHRKMDDFGIASIEVLEHKQIKRGIHRGGKRRNVHFVLTNEQGDKVEAVGFVQVQKITGLSRDQVRRYESDGLFHFGWRIDSINTPRQADVYEFDAPVEKEVVDLIRRYARHWLTRIIYVPDAENVLAFIVAHVAADYSRGLHKEAKCSFKRWIYARIRRWGFQIVKDSIKVNSHELKDACQDYGDDYWIESFGDDADEYDARERLMFDEMPDDLKGVARGVQGGYLNADIAVIEGISDDEVSRRRQRLAAWLQARIRGEDD